MVYIIITACVLALLIPGLATFLILRRKKSDTQKKTTKTKFDAEMEKFEKSNFKKCRQCGGNVPIGDNICPECNQVP